MKSFSFANKFVAEWQILGYTKEDMPYYKIIIWLKNGKARKGIRQIDVWNIDVVHNMMQTKAKSHFRENEIKAVDVYMLSKHSREVKRLK